MDQIAHMLIFISGIARAAFATREYHGLDSRLYDILPKRWYVGGDAFNQSLFTKADFKHMAFGVWNWTLWPGAFIFGTLFGIRMSEGANWLELVLRIVEPAASVVVLHGWIFVLFFHYIFQRKPDGNIVHFLLRVLRPWR